MIACRYLVIALFAFGMSVADAGRSLADVGKDKPVDQIKVDRIKVDSQCSFNGAKLAEYVDVVSAPDKVHSISRVHQFIDRLSSYFGTQPDFSTRAANIPNAAAVLSGNKRYILYNERFYYALINYTKSEWSAIGVFGHEIGHHLANHPLRANQAANDRLYYELQADWYSGFIQGKMGATRKEAQLAVMTAAPAYATFTHPGRNARLAAVKNGWDTACKFNIRCKTFSSQSARTLDSLPVRNSYTCQVLGQQLLINKNKVYWIKFPDKPVGRRIEVTDTSDRCAYNLKVANVDYCVEKKSGSVLSTLASAPAKQFGTCTKCRAGLCP